VTVLVVVVTAAAAACTASPAATPESSVPSPFADPVGTVTIDPGQPIRLGTLLATSGRAEDIGVDSMRGVEMAVDFLDGAFDGKAGTLLGHPIELVDRDEACDPHTARGAAKSLVADQQVVGVIGTTCSSTALDGVSRTMSAAGMLLISPSNTDPRLTDRQEHEPYYLRVAYDERVQSAVVADFAMRELDARSAATIADGDPYAPVPPAGFDERFQTLGGTARASVVIPDDDADARRLLDAISAVEPEVVYAASVGPGCRRMRGLVGGTEGFADAAFVQADGCMSSSAFDERTSPAAGYVAGPDLSRSAQGEFYAQEFLPAYRDRFGTEPIGPFHAYAFDAATMLFDAIEVSAVRSDDGTIRIGRSELRNAAFSTDGYQGISGVLTCTPLGDCATDTTIAIFRMPDVPLEGGRADAEPVFRETLSLDQLEP
jgi:branched-chain amino acid transport system substrate-binding protein